MHIERFRALKAEFDHVHQHGMDGLKSGDHEALGDAIRRERQIIEEQGTLIDEVKVDVQLRESRRRNSLRSFKARHS
jgi:hypothetical protein